MKIEPPSEGRNRIAQVEIIVFKMVEGIPLFLMMKRALDRGGFWQPVTGGVDEGEVFVEAAKRELFEETNISNIIRMIEDVHYFEFESIGFGWTKEYVFGAEVSEDVEVELSSEHSEMRWSTLEDALKLMRHDHNKDAIKKLTDLIG